MLAQESGPKPFAMPAERAAEFIVQGLQRNRSIIAFPFWFSLVTRLGGLLPERLAQWTICASRSTNAVNQIHERAGRSVEETVKWAPLFCDNR